MTVATIRYALYAHNNVVIVKDTKKGLSLMEK
jgi:hypothetical protein